MWIAIVFFYMGFFPGFFLYVLFFVMIFFKIIFVNFIFLIFIRNYNTIKHIYFISLRRRAYMSSSF